MIDSRVNSITRVLAACSAALLGLVMAFVLLKDGSLAAPVEGSGRAAAMVTFDVQGLDSPVASVVAFTVTVTPQSTITDPETLVRYHITATQEGNPLSGQDIYYPESGDPLDDPTQWHSFTTEADGTAYFGPAGGFNLGAIGDGITTTFWTRLGSGDYTLDLQLREEPTGTVRGETTYSFTVRPAVQFATSGLGGDLISGTVPFSIAAQVTETTGISTTPPITTWLRYRAEAFLDASPLAGQVIYYPAAGDDVQDPSTWHLFTTNAEGVAWFGPPNGFRLSDLPELTQGITTPFQTDLVPGTYTLTLALMDITDGQEDARNLGAGVMPFEVQAPASRFFVYLPLTLKDYSPPVPLSNGDFEIGDFSGWETLSDGFPGYGGSGLPQSVVPDDTSVALLGDPDFVNGSIPVGYGAIAQTFTVEDRYLRFRYRVYSDDIFRNDAGRYYDTFEVSLNQPPQDVANAQRDTVCADLNPGGSSEDTSEAVVGEVGLLVCGGRASVSEPEDSGWLYVELDLDKFVDERISLYFHVWSRQYTSPAYNDQGWWNTWAMVDDVEWVTTR